MRFWEWILARFWKFPPTIRQHKTAAHAKYIWLTIHGFYTGIHVVVFIGVILINLIGDRRLFGGSYSSSIWHTCISTGTYHLFKLLFLIANEILCGPTYSFEIMPCVSSIIYERALSCRCNRFVLSFILKGIPIFLFIRIIFMRITRLRLAKYQEFSNENHAEARFCKFKEKLIYAVDIFLTSHFIVHLIHL